MRPHGTLVIAAALALVSSSAFAQTAADSLTPAQIAVACSPPPALGIMPVDGLRIVGSQDAAARSLFGTGDLLVVNGGTPKGLQPGQRYFLRRPVRFGDTHRGDLPSIVHTSGWVRVVAVNETTAIVAVDHVCSDILNGDYLEVFEPPTVPENADASDATGAPDFSSLGRILFSDDQHSTVGSGQYMLIDRGSEHGVAPGSRFAIYRDLHVRGVPLSAVGEATAVSIGKRLALVHITTARDAITSGDIVVPRKN